MSISSADTQFIIFFPEGIMIVQFFQNISPQYPGERTYITYYRKKIITITGLSDIFIINETYIKINAYFKYI